MKQVFFILARKYKTNDTGDKGNRSIYNQLQLRTQKISSQLPLIRRQSAVIMHVRKDETATLTFVGKTHKAAAINFIQVSLIRMRCEFSLKKITGYQWWEIPRGFCFKVLYMGEIFIGGSFTGDNPFGGKFSVCPRTVNCQKKTVVLYVACWIAMRYVALFSSQKLTKDNSKQSR